MVIICDACETVLEKGKSKCCGADVWAELRAHSQRYICQECNNDCETIDEDEIPEVDEEEDDTTAELQ